MGTDFSKINKFRWILVYKSEQKTKLRRVKQIWRNKAGIKIHSIWMINN